MSEQEFDDSKMTQDPDPKPQVDNGDTGPGQAGYSPSKTEVNRNRPSLGVGQEDLNIQQDPTRRNSSEQY